MPRAILGIVLVHNVQMDDAMIFNRCEIHAYNLIGCLHFHDPK